MGASNGMYIYYICRWSCIICSVNCSHSERHWRSDRFITKWRFLTRIAGQFAACKQPAMT